jgi:hypothetical protein
MLLLALFATAATPQSAARVTVLIARRREVTEQEWERLGRKREVIRAENGRQFKIRLIEFE